MAADKSNMQGFFISGSDTGVGKTRIGCQLVQQLRKHGDRLKVRKPVESGCKQGANGQLVPADGLALFQANGQQENLDIVTPYRFRAALAPDRAAHIEGASITLAQLTEAVLTNANPDDTLLVEGAGGFYSPIASDGLNADLARALGLDVIIIVDDRLGAINQALLTIRAVISEGLCIAAVVLNQTKQPADSQLDNLSDLTSRQDSPVYQCTFEGTLPDIQLL